MDSGAKLHKHPPEEGPIRSLAQPLAKEPEAPEVAKEVRESRYVLPSSPKALHLVLGREDRSGVKHLASRAIVNAG